MPENEAIKKADEIMHVVVKDVAVTLAIKAMQAEVTFLALPIISNIFTYIVGSIADRLYKELENFVAFRIIDSQINAEVVAYKKALENVVATGGKSNAEIEEYKKALRNLIHYGGH